MCRTKADFIIHKKGFNAITESTLSWWLRLNLLHHQKAYRQLTQNQRPCCPATSVNSSVQVLRSELIRLRVKITFGKVGCQAVGARAQGAGVFAGDEVRERGGKTAT